MSKYEFILLVSDNISLFLILTVVSLLLYLMVFKGYFYSVFDPFFFYFVLIYSFSFSDILFLYVKSKLSFYYLIYFILSQLTFFFSFYFFGSKGSLHLESASTEEYKHRIDLNCAIILYISSALYLSLQLLTYIVSGIPILMESRWETYSGGSGFGIVSRVIDVVGFVSIYLTIHLIMYANLGSLKRFYFFFTLFLYVLFGLLSGSKIGLVQFLFIGYLVYQCGYRIGLNNSVLTRKLKKYSLVVMFFSIISALLISFVSFYIKMNAAGVSLDEMLMVQNPIIGFLNRFIFNGDIYVMSLPNGVIENVKKHNDYLAIFDNVFAAIRLISWQDMPPNIGFQVESLVNPDNYRLEGPTTHYSIFGLVNYGFIGGLFFSLITGCVIGFFYNALFRVAPKSVFGGLTYSIFAYSSLFFSINPQIGVEKLFNIILVYGGVCFLSHLIYVTSVSTKPVR